MGIGYQREVRGGQALQALVFEVEVDQVFRLQPLTQKVSPALMQEGRLPRAPHSNYAHRLALDRWQHDGPPGKLRQRRLDSLEDLVLDERLQLVTHRCHIMVYLAV